MFLLINFLIITRNMKICLYSPAKKEKYYIREFVGHYKQNNVDVIFLYDNNNIRGEHFEIDTNDYIESWFVKVINFRGKQKALYDMMNDCYKKNYLNYNWIVFYEIDE